MLRNLLLFSSALIIFSSCGPAAEDREQMHRNAKRFQDSIAIYIQNRIAEAEPQTAQPAAPAISDTVRQQQPAPGQPR
jgi:hypothetical protein